MVKPAATREIELARVKIGWRGDGDTRHRTLRRGVRDSSAMVRRHARQTSKKRECFDR